MRFVKINKICVIIVLLLGTVSYAQANIDVIQYSAEFVKDNEISLNNFKQYNTRVLYMSKDADSFVENKVEYIPTIILFHNGEEVFRVEAGISLTLPSNTIQLIDNQIDSILESKF